jgi:hypothetical protein
MRSHLVQLALWLIGPALGTLLIIAVTTAVHDYQPQVTGHAMQAPSAECVPSPDEMFNACAVLDTSQVHDLRTGWDEKLCRDAAGTDCWTEHHADDDTELEIP